MSKKCTPLWREAHFEVKMYKAHFWKLRCRKSARRCGAKHIWKSKCTKHHMFAPLLEVRMLKKCTPLWREAHFEVKMYKTPHVRATFGGSDVASLHYTTLHHITRHYLPLHFTTLHYTPLQLQLRLHNYTPLHEITLHYTPLHYNYNYDYTTTLHYTKLHYTTLHYTTLHYIPLHSTTLHYITLHYNTLNDTAPQIDR